MKLSMCTLSLSTLFSLVLAMTAPVVKAQPKILDYSTSNPPAEVPSPSLIELDPSSALNPAQLEQSPTPLTKSLSLNQPAVTLNQPTVMAPNNNVQILDIKNTPAEVPSPILRNYQH